MFLLYDLVLLISAAVLIPYYLLRGLRVGKVRRGIRERFGFYAPGRLAPLEGKRVIWVHAVSVGETRAAIPLVKALKRRYPETALVLTNITETGHAIARDILEIDLCLFFPFDFTGVIRRVLSLVRPSLIVIVETEIWPNFVRLAREAGVPVMLANGRISDRSFPRYRMARPLLRPILEKFSAFCMQTELDAVRIQSMGAPEDRIEVTRNLKFDMHAAVPGFSEVAALKAELGLPGDVLIWVAGSTHAGEEEQIVDVYRQMLQEGRNIVLILVPRHPERCSAVGDMLCALNIPFVRRSEPAENPGVLPAGSVLLGDTLGEMLMFYSVADLVFVGGSLVDIGGHNVLEAALVKKPAIFGPHMHNFKEISRLLLEADGGVQVEDSETLLAAVRRLIDDPVMRDRMGAGGHALLERNAGATEQTLAAIDRLLASEPVRSEG